MGGVLPEESLKARLTPPHEARESARRGANSSEWGPSLTRAPSRRCHGDGRPQSAQALCLGHQPRAVTGGAEKQPPAEGPPRASWAETCEAEVEVA